MVAPLAQSLPVRSSTPQPHESANPFAVRVHPDACMEVGRMPDGGSPLGDITMSPSQSAAMCDAREAHRAENFQRLHSRMYSGAPAGSRAMYASYVDPEPAGSPSKSPAPPQLTSSGFNMQMYGEPAGVNPRHAVGMDLDPHSDPVAARKNVSASHGSTATGLGMFPGADVGTVPGRPHSATPSVYSHPMHAAQRGTSAAIGSMPPPSHIRTRPRARSMVLQGSIDENHANGEDLTAQRSNTMPRPTSVAAEMLEDPEPGAPAAVHGLAGDAGASVMGQLSNLLSVPGPAGLPPGVIAGAHMHRRETRTAAEGATGPAHCSSTHVNIPTSGSDGSVACPNHSDGLPSHVQATVHSGSRPATDSMVLGAGGVSGAMHASVPARPFTDSALAHLSPHIPGRMTDGGAMDRGMAAQHARSSSWAGGMATGAAGGGPRMCFSSSGTATGVATHTAHNGQFASARAGTSPAQSMFLSGPLETLRLTPDMMHSGSFPGHMGRTAGVQQQLQLQQMQRQQHPQQPPLLTDDPATLAAALKQASQEQTASYIHSHAHITSQGLPMGSGAGLGHWGGVNANGTSAAMGDGERLFLQAGALGARSDASNPPGSSMPPPVSLDRMSEGDSEYDEEHDGDGHDTSPQTHHTLCRDGKGGATTARGSVQGIATPEKPNPALLREWSGYGMTARELMAAGVKSGDSAREASGEPPGMMGGVTVKQEDCATGDGTSGAVYSSHRNGVSGGDADKPPRRKRASGLTAEERRERRRKSNRESARRSRVRKLEETHESETAIATLQNSVTQQAKMLSVATSHLETMKVCLSHQEARVGTLCDGISQLLGTIRAEAAVGNVTSPVAKQAAALQKTLIHEASMAPQAHANSQQ